MHLKLLAAAGVAALMLSAPARADASCCDQKPMPCCQQQQAMKDMPCCDKDAIEMIMAMSQQATPAVDPQLNPAPPARQVTEIFFQRPTFVGKSILQGRYVIEHDNDRMARGEPCTYIYAYEDRTKPVVMFHCTHLERPRSNQNIAVLVAKGDMVEMQEFQFAGETASHGVPDTIR